MQTCTNTNNAPTALVFKIFRRNCFGKEELKCSCTVLYFFRRCGSRDESRRITASAAAGAGECAFSMISTVSVGEGPPVICVVKKHVITIVKFESQCYCWCSSHIGAERKIFCAYGNFDLTRRRTCIDISSYF